MLSTASGVRAPWGGDTASERRATASAKSARIAAAFAAAERCVQTGGEVLGAESNARLRATTTQRERASSGVGTVASSSAGP